MTDGVVCVLRPFSCDDSPCGGFGSEEQLQEGGVQFRPMVSRYLGIPKQLWTVAVVGGVSLSDHWRMSACWSSSSRESLTGRGGLWAGVPCHVRGGVAIAARSEAVWWSSAIRECRELWIVYSGHVHIQVGTILEI